MSAGESSHGSRYLVFARRVMGRAGLLGTAWRSAERGDRLRQKYTVLPRIKPLSARRWEPLVRQLPLEKRRVDGEELVLASGRWSQEAERETVRPEPAEVPQREPSERGVTRAADMRAAVQRVRDSAGARRGATQRGEGQFHPPAARRTGQEGLVKERRPFRRGSQIVEEPDRERAAGPERAQPLVAQPSPVVEESELPRQRGGIPTKAEELIEEGAAGEGPGKVLSEEFGMQEVEAPASASPTARPVQEPSPASTAPPERAAERDEEITSASGVEGADIASDSMEADVEAIEKRSEVSPEPISQEVGERGIPRRGVSSDGEGAGPLRRSGMPAFTEMGTSREEERWGSPVGSEEIYTRLGATSYEGNLSPEGAPPLVQKEPRERAEERSSVVQGQKRASEGVPRRASLEELEVTEEVVDTESSAVRPRVHGPKEARPSREMRAQQPRTSAEGDVAGDDALVSRETQETAAPEVRSARELGRPAKPETAPGAKVAPREPRAIDPTTTRGRLTEKEAQTPPEEIEDSEERVSARRSPAMSQERDAEQVGVGEGVPADSEGSDLQDVPLEEALFGASEVLRRAPRPFEEEGETLSPLSSLYGRPSDVREDVSADLVRQAEAEQVPMEATSEVESAEVEPPEVLEEEEREELDVDKLADEVYRRIRDRLRVERERYGTRGRW